MKVSKELIDDLFSLWNDLAESGQISIRREFSEKYDLLKSQVEVLQSEAVGVGDEIKKALNIIANWQTPETGKFWDDEKTRPTSYEAEYGSNGARDYMKQIARDALASIYKFPSPSELNDEMKRTSHEKFVAGLHKILDISGAPRRESSATESEDDYVLWRFAEWFEGNRTFTKENMIAFADWLPKNFQPRFPNKGEWISLDDKKKFKTIYTTSQLLQIYKDKV